MHSHPSEEQLIGYIHQTLPDAEREGIDRHLANCSSCRSRLTCHEALQRRIYYDLMGDLRNVEPSSRMSFDRLAPRLKRSRRLVTLRLMGGQFSYAAAVVALVLLVSTLITSPSRVDLPVTSTPLAVGYVLRGNLHRTGVYGTDAVPQLGEVVWLSPMSTWGQVAPVVAGDTIYTYNDERHYFYALDSHTGKERWKISAAEASPPAIVDQGVYVGIGQTFYMLDNQTGEAYWKVVLDAPVKSSPIFYDETVYVPTTMGVFYALDGGTGEEKWSFEAQGGIYSSPALADGLVYFGSRDGYLYALDDQTGDLAWTFEVGDWIDASPAVANGMVYVGSADRCFYAVDARTGQEVWQFQTKGCIYSSAAVDGEAVYFGSEDGCLYALDSDTGALKWTFETGQYIKSSPVLAGGLVYFGGYDSYFYALDARGGREVWKLAVEGAVTTSPVIADGIIYFSAEGQGLYAVR